MSCWSLARRHSRQAAAPFRTLVDIHGSGDSRLASAQWLTGCPRAFAAEPQRAAETRSTSTAGHRRRPCRRGVHPEPGQAPHITALGEALNGHGTARQAGVAFSVIALWLGHAEHDHHASVRRSRDPSTKKAALGSPSIAGMDRIPSAARRATGVPSGHVGSRRGASCDAPRWRWARRQQLNINANST